MQIPLQYQWIRELLSEEAIEKAVLSATTLISRKAIMPNGTIFMITSEVCVRKHFPDLTPEQMNALNFYVIGLAAAAGFQPGTLASVNSAPGLQYLNLGTKLSEGTPEYEAMMLLLEADIEPTEDDIRSIK